MVLTIAKIKDIANKITAVNERKRYNSIIKLINELNISDTKELSKDDDLNQKLRFLTLALFQIFKKLFSRGDLSFQKSEYTTTESAQFIRWCRKIYDTFKVKLLAIISDIPFESSLALDALDVYMQLLELESVHFSSQKDDSYFPTKTFRALILAIWKSDIGKLEINPGTGESENPIIVEFTEKYYKCFADIQYYFQLEFRNIIDDDSTKNYILSNGMGKWLTIINHDKHMCCADADLDMYTENPPQAIENESKFKSNYEKNWLSLLNSDLSLQQYKTILLVLHKRLIPYFQTPTRLMDFLTDACNLQPTDGNVGVVPILALNGLFELMRKFNLEYPNFFVKLYQIITPDLMHVKYRARFFRLIDIFLSSTHLSAHLVASFIKKLARLTPDSSPAAIVIVIPFVYNLIRKHPSCMVMLHNPAFVCDPLQTPEQIQEFNTMKNEYVDPFDINEPNPELTHALDSSLWELASLMDHYHPNVASLAKIFSLPFRKASYNMEDFLDWSYDSLLEAEASRKLKILPALEFESFEGLFEQEDVDSVEDNTYISGVDW